MSHIGFHVWNPAGHLPTAVHKTIEKAVSEAERLTRANPGQSFVVMSPVLSTKDALTAKAWSDGHTAGLVQAQSEIVKAERNADLWGDELADLRKSMRQLQAIKDRSAPFQAIVADCLLWFDGFAAAHSPKEAWERPHLPDRERLRQLNAALQALLPPGLQSDDEIPF